MPIVWKENPKKIASIGKMNYWAHSGNKTGKIHNLSDHLKCTAQLAESFAINDKMKSVFKLTGLLHDFGKYQPEFQRYLREGGKRGSVPHSVWGAGYARLNKMNSISMVVDGHHKGLPNKSNWQNDTEAFKRNEIENFDLIMKSYMQDNKLDKAPLIDEINEYISLKRELFIRYLFSSLTDADWLDTENHFKPETAANRANRTLDIECLLGKLNKEFLSKPKEGEINNLRNQVREEVLKKADKPRGFYSLNLPTEMGKTLISIAWALCHAKRNNLKRIFIVLPYVNIIDQTAEELKRIFGEEWVLEHHSGYNEEKADINEDEYSILPNEKQKQLACENWSYPIVVTTTVQFFESLFSNRPSKCRKIHNISESVVIFDEVQSLPKETILPTLTMIENVNEIMRTSFLFCTATQPAFENRDNFKGIRNIEPLIENPKNIFKKIERVKYRLINNLLPTDSEDILQAIKLENNSVLAIFNTKKAALEFYYLSEKSKDCWEKIYHLSTFLCPADRKNIIKEIRQDLEAKRKIFVASTQLIEAGVDFDFPCVFRSLSPLESIIQAAGRCNREGTMHEKGKVYVFQLKDSGMPDRTYSACAEHAKNMIIEDSSVLHDHDLFRKYYSQIVNLFVDPDKNHIIDAQSKFDYETVNDSYHLINSSTKGLFIYNCSEDSKKLFHSLEYKQYLSRDDWRKMQIYTVQVYQNFLFKNSGMYKEMPQGFLVWYGNYNNKTGISVEALDADKLIV